MRPPSPGYRGPSLPLPAGHDIPKWGLPKPPSPSITSSATRHSPSRQMRVDRAYFYHQLRPKAHGEVPLSSLPVTTCGGIRLLLPLVQQWPGLKGSSFLRRAQRPSLERSPQALHHHSSCGLDGLPLSPPLRPWNPGQHRRPSGGSVSWRQLQRNSLLAVKTHKALGEPSVFKVQLEMPGALWVGPGRMRG